VRGAQRFKRWPGWVLLVFVVVGFLAVGAGRANGPSTPAERAEAIEKRVACPVCDGESVFESRNTASENIRNTIGGLVDAGELDDDEIVAVIESRFGGQILLVPRASGFDALVWALPVAALICALAGLAFTFRRWRREAAAEVDPTDDDRALVAAALASEDEAPAAERDP
jgi:cytochrome c-type biogenesis protein CcmH